MGKFRQTLIPFAAHSFHSFDFRKVKLHRKSTASQQVREVPLPSISILKPLMGRDPNLQQNLETFFTMNYETVIERAGRFDRTDQLIQFQFLRIAVRITFLY